MTRVLVAALVALVALAACGGGGPSKVARLLEGQGEVQAEHAGKTAAAPNGQPFYLGDAARTGPGAWARLELRGGAVVRLGADTVVRFVAGGARLERGEAGAEAGAITIDTEAGAAEIEAGGVLRATSGDRGVRFEVVVGRAIIQRGEGPVALEPGGGLVVAIGGAVVERIGPRAAEPAPPPPPPPPPPPATLTATVRGRGVTARTGTAAPRPLAEGAVTLAEGDVVKLPKRARLELGRGADAVTATGPAELVIGGPDGPLVTARTGTTRVQARDAALAVAVPGGTMVVQVGGEAAIAIGRRDASAAVERGEVLLDGTVSDATAHAGEVGLLTHAGAASVPDPAPTTIDVAIPAGAGAIIHDPGKKVAVRVDFGSACDGAGGVLEAGARRIGGKDGAAFFAGAGTTRYRVRCDGGGTRSGSVRVAGDTGAAPVARGGAASSVNDFEADGHRYQVSYQNRIPPITLRWSEASGPTTLRLQPASGPARTFTATGPHVLATGTLDEGSYTFTIASGKRTSPLTTLRIAFDNAAPTAQITAPPARAEWSDPLTVTGVTVEGWSVEVDGKAPDRDGSGRFRAQVATAGKNVIAIRLAHPQHGVHYYLRRRK